jgi:hypothetical protein
MNKRRDCDNGEQKCWFKETVLADDPEDGEGDIRRNIKV